MVQDSLLSREENKRKSPLNALITQVAQLLIQQLASRPTRISISGCRTFLRWRMRLLRSAAFPLSGGCPSELSPGSLHSHDEPSLEQLIDANSFRQIRQLCRFTTFNCEMRRALFILSEETACSKIGPNRIRLKVPCRSHYQVGTIRQVNSKRPGGGGRT